MPNGFDIPIPFLNQTFHIYFYGILITIGVIAAALLAALEAKRRGFNPDYIWDALFWVVIAGVIGARLWHIFTPPPSMVEQGLTTRYYLTHPLDILNIRKGGLGIPGAVIGGAIALWFYCRKKKISFLTWADMIAPGVALAQAIGRWGNFLTRKYMVSRPIYLGRFSSILFIEFPVTKITSISIHSSCMSLYGTCSTWQYCW